MITYYYLGHQGWTDFLSQYSLYISFIQAQPSDSQAVILIHDLRLFKFVYRLFVESSKYNISIEQVQVTPNPTTCCVICHTPGEKQCPRNSSGPCQFPNLNVYPNFKGLCCFDTPNLWFPHLNSILESGNSFVHAFYSFYSLPFDTLWKNFELDLEHFLQQVPSKLYIPYHDTVELPIYIPTTTEEQPLKLRDTFDDIVSAIPFLRTSKEIHTIPSVYAMLLYLLQLKYNLFETIPIYIYTTSRDINTPYKNLYTIPQLDNWTFL
jgi:hypothetical protein